MKITLKEAYAKAPTAPLLNNDQHRVQPNLGLLIKSLADNPGNAALLVHAFNVLPQVVAALEEMISEQVDGPFFHEDEHSQPECALQKARAAVAKANQVEVT